MAPRGRLLDLETHDVDVLFFYGSYQDHHGDRASVAAAHAIAFWPVLLAAALLLHLVVSFPRAAAAVCAGLYGAYWFLLRHRAARRQRSQPSSAGHQLAAPSRASRSLHARWQGIR